MNCAIYEISKLSREAIPILSRLLEAGQTANNHQLRILLRLFRDMQKLSMKTIRSFNFPHDDIELKANTTSMYNCAENMEEELEILKATIGLSQSDKLIGQLEYRVKRTVELLIQLMGGICEVYEKIEVLDIMKPEFHKQLECCSEKGEL